MKLYNTMTEKVEPFTPRGNDVAVYVCGITPYDTTHLGHAFTYTSMDILIRYLELRDLDVKYVQNVTDIDDDILKRAAKVGEDWRDLGNRWTNHFVQDMQTLNVRPPDYYPRATQVIDEIIDSVKELLDAGVAYVSGGSVYFSVHEWAEFGKLSKMKYPEMLPVANERGNRPDDPAKRDPLDFVLWQAAVAGEPSWPSPWGEGRPGWHIECSTMSTMYLGKVVDIHGGGADLCFPHHECEIAQVEATRKERPFVRYWMHTAMVRYEGEKMSKSLGNLVMVRDLLTQYSPDSLRLYLASHHYREAWSYEEKDLMRQAELATRMLQAVQAESGSGPKLEGEPYWATFTNHLDNDLDTPAAIETLERLTEELLEAALGGRDVSEAQDTLRELAGVLGLRLDASSDDRTRLGWDRYFTPVL